MLESPLFWGRLIDFDHPFLANESWKTEVLRRSGNAPLWVKGTTIKAFQAIQYFLDVINKEWERIQVLDIDLNPPGRSQANEQAQVWVELLRPAPMLQTLKLLYTFRPNPFPESSIRLFNGNAPQLKVFHAAGVPISLQAPWVSNIQDIELADPFTLSDVLSALRNMRAIRRLLIQAVKPSDADITEHTPPIQLPRLEALQVLGCSLPVWVAILESIIPVPSCSFQLADRKESMSGQPGEELLERACQQVLKALEFFLAHSPAPRDCCMLGYDADQPTHFHLFLDDEANKPHFTIYIGEYPRLSRLLISRLPSLLLLSGVKTVRLRIGNPAADLLPPLNLLISLFTSVKALMASEEVLNFLLESCDPGSLPKLDTLIFYLERESRRRRPVQWDQKYPLGIVMAFLEHRKRMNLPLSRLQFSDILPSMRDNMDCLEVLSGLRVRYENPIDRTITDYTCGSGQPEKLRFLGQLYREQS